jgi:hypothetical protein
VFYPLAPRGSVFGGMMIKMAFFPDM